MYSFWWGKKNNSSPRIYWACWECLSLPKDHGSPSFKILHEFDLALLGKQAWKFVTEPNALVSRCLPCIQVPRHNARELEAPLFGYQKPMRTVVGSFFYCLLLSSI